MSREGLFRVRSARAGGGRSRCRAVYRRCSEIWGSCSGRAHSGWRFRFRAPSIREVDFAFCRAAARGFFSRKAWRAASRLDRGRRSGTRCLRIVRRFRKAAHVFVCRFDLADSCGFRPDGPFFRCHVRARDFAPAGCGSQSQAAHPVRTLPRILAAGGGLVQGAERIGNSTVGTEKINEARKARRTYRAADTGM